MSPQGKEEGRRPHPRQPPPQSPVSPNSGAKEGLSGHMHPCVHSDGSHGLPCRYLSLPLPCGCPGSLQALLPRTSPSDLVLTMEAWWHS